MTEIVITPTKQIEICCGIARSSIEEFYIGSLEDDSLIHVLERGNKDLIVNWLALAGPSSIAEMVRSVNPLIDLPAAYVNRCHLCNELFTREEVVDIIRKNAMKRAPMVALMRGVLDWITDDWAPGARK